MTAPRRRRGHPPLCPLLPSVRGPTPSTGLPHRHHRSTSLGPAGKPWMIYHTDTCFFFDGFQEHASLLKDPSTAAIANSRWQYFDFSKFSFYFSNVSTISWKNVLMEKSFHFLYRGVTHDVDYEAVFWCPPLSRGGGGRRTKVLPAVWLGGRCSALQGWRAWHVNCVHCAIRDWSLVWEAEGLVAPCDVLAALPNPHLLQNQAYHQ